MLLSTIFTVITSRKEEKIDEKMSSTQKYADIFDVESPHIIYAVRGAGGTPWLKIFVNKNAIKSKNLNPPENFRAEGPKNFPIFTRFLSKNTNFF